jgi:hypothetical protein
VKHWSIPAGLQNIPMGRVGFAGGMIAPAFTAVEEAQAGRPTGALGALGGGLARLCCWCWYW